MADVLKSPPLSDVLHKYWGYGSFRPLQREAMQCVMDDRDSVVVLPTGGGKSLCFQAPALCRPGMAVVVSPLIALMKDQVDALRTCGIAAEFVNSTLSYNERRVVAERIRNGELQLLYMAPERLLADRTIEFLRNANPSFIAVDEAHCISEWGHDFRPEYRQLSTLRRAFPKIAIHAYTATATERVRHDIARNLGLNNPEFLVGSFDRPNLSYKVEHRRDVQRQVREVIERHSGESGIVYCIRRDDVDQTTAALKQAGFRALPYHAGMNDADRRRNQDAFINDRADIMVATVAFGMGIDKPNVRFVIHAGMPKSLENYQQESGRAGRDGLEAECCLFYSGGDFMTWKRMLANLEGEAFSAAMVSVTKISDYCGGVLCRHRALVQHFGEHYGNESCEACDVCLGDFDSVESPQVLAQKILSCVVRLGQRFGADYTSLVLAGSQDKRIIEHQHNRLSTWGLLKTEDRRHLRDWIEQLVGQGCLQKTGEFGLLEVTERGWRVLRSDDEPKLLKPRMSEKSSAEKPSAVKRASKTAAQSWEGVDKELFEVLKTLRNHTAKERGVPAYIVFGDNALRDMARLCPTNIAGFLLVKGVGEKKAELFGTLFLETIGNYCRSHGLETDRIA